MSSLEKDQINHDLQNLSPPHKKMFTMFFTVLSFEVVAIIVVVFRTATIKLAKIEKLESLNKVETY